MGWWNRLEHQSIESALVYPWRLIGVSFSILRWFGIDTRKITFSSIWAQPTGGRTQRILLATNCPPLESIASLPICNGLLRCTSTVTLSQCSVRMRERSAFRSGSAKWTGFVDCTITTPLSGSACWSIQRRNVDGNTVYRCTYG